MSARLRNYLLFRWYCSVVFYTGDNVPGINKCLGEFMSREAFMESSQTHILLSEQLSAKNTKQILEKGKKDRNKNVNQMEI